MVPAMHLQEIKKMKTIQWQLIKMSPLTNKLDPQLDLCQEVKRCKAKITYRLLNAGIINGMPRCCWIPTPIRPSQQGKWSGSRGAVVQHLGDTTLATSKLRHGRKNKLQWPCSGIIIIAKETLKLPCWLSSWTEVLLRCNLPSSPLGEVLLCAASLCTGREGKNIKPQSVVVFLSNL